MSPALQQPFPSLRPSRRLSSQLPLPSTPTAFSQRPQWLQLSQPSPLLDEATASPSPPSPSGAVEGEEEELPGFVEPAPVDLALEARLRSAPTQLPPSPSLPSPTPPVESSTAVGGGWTSAGPAYDPWKADAAPLLRVKAKSTAPPPPPPFRSKRRALPHQPLLSGRKRGSATSQQSKPSTSSPPHLLTPTLEDPTLSAPLTQVDVDVDSASTQPVYPHLSLPPFPASHPVPVAHSLPSYASHPWLPLMPAVASQREDGGVRELRTPMSFAYPAAPWPPPPPPPPSLPFTQPGLGFFPPPMGGPPLPFPFPPPLFSQPPFDFALMMLGAPPPPPAAQPVASSIHSQTSPISSHSSSSCSTSSMSPLQSSDSPSPPLPTAGSTSAALRPQPSHRWNRRFCHLVEQLYRPVHRRIRRLQHRQPYQAAEIRSTFSRKQLSQVTHALPPPTHSGLSTPTHFTRTAPLSCSLTSLCPLWLCFGRCSLLTTTL